MNKLGSVNVGGTNPVRIMGILNTSPESFYKKYHQKGQRNHTRRPANGARWSRFC